MATGFQFTKEFGDGRVEELKLLAWTDEKGQLSVQPRPKGPWQDLLAHLLWTELLTVFTFKGVRDLCQLYADARLIAPMWHEDDIPFVRAKRWMRVNAVIELYDDCLNSPLHLTHLGRVRLSELKQALRSGRQREPFGILWDGRHFDQDLQIAVLDARKESPLALAYMDMNGLGQINNGKSHHDGDRALKAYFEAVASAVADRGEAYRLSGGADEVMLLLPNHDEQAALKIAQLACTKLGNERLWLNEPSALLSISVGIVTATDSSFTPAVLKNLADEEQRRAKQRSRAMTPPPSVIAIKGKDDLIEIPHGSRDTQSAQELDG